MELTNTQLTALNTLLPPKYKLLPIIKKDTRPRKSEADNLDFDVRFQASDPVERPARAKKTVSYEEADLAPKQGEPFRKIYKILQTLKKHPMAEPFLAPVDPVLVPDYRTTIQEPMDLGTVEQKLKNGEYESGYQFAMDIRLIWSNSFFYNAKGSDLYHMTMELSSLFEKLMKGNESLILVEKQDIVQDLYRKIEKLSKGIKEIQSTGTTSAKVQVKQQPPPPQPDKIMTLQEKKLLCQNIKRLDPKFLRGVLDIVQECMDVQGEELEFDIDKLPSKVCRELEKYVRGCLQNPTKPQSRKKQTPVVETPKPAPETTTNRLKDLDSQLQQLVQQTRTEPQAPPQPEESESESSSTSESDDDDLPQPERNIGGNPYMDTDIIPSSMWVNHFQENIDVDHDFTTGAFGGIMDFDKTHDLFK
mmetsp:Transcript_368/g.396  ORF Transcript_368/g.396 Transcript_368/m.396 type:complete len:418 (-) Transcript_368:34-1287(-)